MIEISFWGVTTQEYVKFLTFYIIVCKALAMCDGQFSILFLGQFSILFFGQFSIPFFGQFSILFFSDSFLSYFWIEFYPFLDFLQFFLNYLKKDRIQSQNSIGNYPKKLDRKLSEKKDRKLSKNRIENYCLRSPLAIK